MGCSGPHKGGGAIAPSPISDVRLFLPKIRGFELRTCLVLISYDFSSKVKKKRWKSRGNGMMNFFLRGLFLVINFIFEWVQIKYCVRVFCQKFAPKIQKFKSCVHPCGCCCWCSCRCHLFVCVLKRRTIAHIITGTPCMCSCCFFLFAFPSPPPRRSPSTIHVQTYKHLSLSRVSAKVSVLYYNPFDFQRTHRLHERPRP